VLAVGLGLVIYFGLPSAARRQGHDYAKNTPAASAVASAPGGGGGSAATSPAQMPAEIEAARNTFTDGGGAARRGMSISDAAGDSTRSTLATSGPAAGKAVALSPTAPSGGAAPESLQSLAARVPKLWSPEQQRALFDARGRRGDAAGVAVGPAVYLVLSTSEPAAAREEVTQELEKLQLAWEMVPARASLAQRDEPVRAQAQNELGKKSAEKNLYEKKDNLAAAAGGLPGGMRGAAPAAAPAATVPAAPEHRSESADASEARRPQPSSRPESPAVTSAGVPPIAAGVSGVASPSPDSASTDIFAGAPSAAAPELILARNITRRQAELLCTNLSARRPDQQVAVWTAQGETSLSPAKLEVAQVEAQAPAAAAAAAPADEQGLATTTPEPQPTARGGGEAGAKSKVALRTEVKDAELRQRAAGAEASPAAPAPPARERLARRGVAEPSTGAASNTDEAGHLTEVDRATSGPVAQAKQGAANDPTVSRAMKTAPAPAQRPQASGGARAGREVAAGAAAADADGFARAGEPAAQPDQESDKESKPQSTEAPTPAREPVADARATTSLADATSNGDERIDLVIVVKSPEPAPLASADASGAGASAGAGASPAPADSSLTGPIEKFEILTITVGDADGTNVRVGEDGTIDLPPAGRVAAEGLTTEALGKRISESLGRTNAGAKVTVTRPGAAGAATQPDGAAGEKDAAKGEAQPADPLEHGDAPPPQPPPAAEPSPGSARQ